MIFTVVQSIEHLVFWSKWASENDFMSVHDLELDSRISPRVKKKLFNAIRPFSTNSDNGNKYWDQIPISEIQNTLESFGYTLLQEDNTPWAGMLLGDEANILLHLGVKRRAPSGEGQYVEYYEPVVNAGLSLSWYKMPSGRYEVTVYIS